MWWHSSRVICQQEKHNQGKEKNNNNNHNMQSAAGWTCATETQQIRMQTETVSAPALTGQRWRLLVFIRLGWKPGDTKELKVATRSVWLAPRRRPSAPEQSEVKNLCPCTLRGEQWEGQRSPSLRLIPLPDSWDRWLPSCSLPGSLVASCWRNTPTTTATAAQPQTQYKQARHPISQCRVAAF